MKKHFYCELLNSMLVKNVYPGLATSIPVLATN